MKNGDPRETPQPGGELDAETVADLLPAYVLDALDDDEHRRVEEALATSEAVREEYRRYQSTVDLLSATTTVTAPPARLRERVLPGTGRAGEPVVIASRRRGFGRIALGIAAVLTLALAGVAGLLWSELNEREDELADLQQASRRPSTNFSQPLIWTELSTTEADLPGWGYFCRTEDGAVGWVVVEGMPATGGSVYQIWLVDGDRRESAGMFVTDDAGRGFGVVRADAPVTSFKQLWITIEPPGGSTLPTSDPRVAVNIV